MSPASWTPEQDYALAQLYARRPAEKLSTADIAVMMQPVRLGVRARRIEARASDLKAEYADRGKQWPQDAAPPALANAVQGSLPIDAATVGSSQEKLSVRGSERSATVELARSKRIRSLDELLSAASVDRSAWDVARFEVNKWDLGTNVGETIEVEELFQVKASLIPRAPIPSPLPAPIIVQAPAIHLHPTSKADAQSVKWGCIHLPYHDPRALNIIYQVLSYTDPRFVADLGDTLDCESISKYEKNPHRRIPLLEERRLGAEHFGIVTQLTPNAEERHWFEGNHEDRKRRKLWDACEKDRAMAELLLQPDVAAKLEWSSMLGLDSLGWQTHGYPSHFLMWERLILKHGEVVRSGSGASAKGEYAKYGKSGMSAHTHRRGSYEHRDYNGTHGWWEVGMMGSIRTDHPSYPDWQQGFVVVTWNAKRTEFSVEHIRIHEGVAYFRGRRLVGDSTLFGDIARS